MPDRIDELWSKVNEIETLVLDLATTLNNVRRDLEEQLDRKVDKPYER